MKKALRFISLPPSPSHRDPFITILVPDDTKLSNAWPRLICFSISGGGGEGGRGGGGRENMERNIGKGHHV